MVLKQCDLFDHKQVQYQKLMLVERSILKCKESIITDSYIPGIKHNAFKTPHVINKCFLTSALISVTQP